MKDGQLQTLVMSFVDAALLAVVAFDPSLITSAQQAAVEGVCLAGVNLGVYLWGYYSHATAVVKALRNR